MKKCREMMSVQFKRGDHCAGQTTVRGREYLDIYVMNLRSAFQGSVSVFKN